MQSNFNRIKDQPVTNTFTRKKTFKIEKENGLNSLNIISEVILHQEDQNIDAADLLMYDGQIQKYVTSITKKRQDINNDIYKINGILPQEISSDIIDQNLTYTDSNQNDQNSSTELETEVNSADNFSFG